MKTAFDQHAMNHVIVAINCKMTPLGKKRHADANTMFMGGGYSRSPAGHADADITAAPTGGPCQAADVGASRGVTRRASLGPSHSSKSSTQA